MTGTLIGIGYDGVDSADIPELYVVNITRQMTPGVRDVYVDVPGRDGAWQFAEAAGDRTLSVEFAIVGDSQAERRAAVRKAGRWLYKYGPARKLVLGDEPDRFTWAKLAAAPEVSEAYNLGRFSVEFRTGPYDEETTITTASIVGSDTVTVTDTDDLADDILPVYEITAGAGGLPSGFTLTIGTRSLVYGSAITAGNTVTVSAISSTVTTGASTDTDLDGTYDPSLLAMTAVSGQFPRLSPGANALVITGAATEVDVHYRRRYI